jgi:hypothetical protein
MWVIAHLCVETGPDVSACLQIFLERAIAEIAVRRRVAEFFIAVAARSPLRPTWAIVERPQLRVGLTARDRPCIRLRACPFEQRAGMLKSPRFSRRVSIVRWRLVRRFLFNRLRLRGELSSGLLCLRAKPRRLLAPRAEIADRLMNARQLLLGLDDPRQVRSEILSGRAARPLRWGPPAPAGRAARPRHWSSRSYGARRRRSRPSVWGRDPRAPEGWPDPSK